VHGEQCAVQLDFKYSDVEEEEKLDDYQQRQAYKKQQEKQNKE
jgi:hypothetical protein